MQARAQEFLEGGVEFGIGGVFSKKVNYPLWKILLELILGVERSKTCVRGMLPREFLAANWCNMVASGCCWGKFSALGSKGGGVVSCATLLDPPPPK